MEEIVSIDTNVVVRFLTNDEPRQFEKAFSLIIEKQVFVPDTVILETEWVLRYAYSFSPRRIGEALRSFLGLANVSVEDPARLELALSWHEEGLDFADALHLASCQHTPYFATFDKALLKGEPKTTSCRLYKLEN